jgi:hypothetical protein
MKDVLRQYWFLLPAIILFLFLYGILSFHNRLAADDFFYWGLTKEGGPWYAMMFQYEAFCGRWAAHIPACFFLGFYKIPFTLFIYHLVTLIALLTGIYLLLSKLLLRYFNYSNRNILILYSFLFCIAFFFSSYSISETWFWYIAVWTYMWSIIMSLFLFNELLEARSKLISWPIIMISAAFIGGACESYAVIDIMILVFMILHYRFKKNNKSLGDKRRLNNKIFFALVILSVSFAITYFSPGTTIRKELLPQTSFFEKTYMHFKVYGKLLLILTPPRLPWLILFSLPWIFIGAQLPASPFFNLSIKQYFFRSSLILLTAVFIILLPTSFAMSDLAPGRALSIVSICFCIYFSMLFIYIGRYKNIKEKLKVIGKYSFAVISTVFLIIQLAHQSGLVYFYNRAYDQRIEYLIDLEQKGNKETVELERLPDSGMLYWEEIKTDTSFYVNEQIKRGLDLGYTIKLKEDDLEN